LLLGLAGCGEDREETPPAEARPRLARHEGETLYRRYCALCHGPDGEGYAADNAPALANEQWLRTATDEFITTAIADGRPGTPMSAWSQRHGGPLTDDQVANILAHLRGWQRHPQTAVSSTPVQGNVLRGRTIYRVQCARCHGTRGEGVSAVSLANPKLLATASDGFLEYAVTHGRSGTPMPSFENDLTSSQIDDVVAFMEALTSPEFAGLPTSLGVEK